MRASIYVDLENRATDVIIGRLLLVIFYESQVTISDESGQQTFNIPKTAEELKALGTALKSAADKVVETFGIRRAVSGAKTQP